MKKMLIHVYFFGWQAGWVATELRGHPYDLELSDELLIIVIAQEATKL